MKLDLIYDELYNVTKEFGFEVIDDDRDSEGKSWTIYKKGNEEIPFYDIKDSNILLKRLSSLGYKYTLDPDDDTAFVVWREDLEESTKLKKAIKLLEENNFKVIKENNFEKNFEEIQKNNEKIIRLANVLKEFATAAADAGFTFGRITPYGFFIIDHKTQNTFAINLNLREDESGIVVNKNGFEKRTRTPLKSVNDIFTWINQNNEPKEK